MSLVQSTVGIDARRSPYNLTTVNPATGNDQLIVVPYPLESDGRLVLPEDLETHASSHEFDMPLCYHKLSTIVRFGIDKENHLFMHLCCRVIESCRFGVNLTHLREQRPIWTHFYPERSDRIWWPIIDRYNGFRIPSYVYGDDGDHWEVESGVHWEFDEESLPWKAPRSEIADDSEGSDSSHRSNVQDGTDEDWSDASSVYSNITGLSLESLNIIGGVGPFGELPVDGIKGYFCRSADQQLA